MPQVFHRSTNALARASIVAIVALVAFAGWGLNQLQRSPYVTKQGTVYTQPVPFSHDHHVGAMGIQCGYCHTSVEDSAFAGVPPTETCMNCHSQIWSDSPMLEPVRSSYATGEPLEWTRINDLPDYVYFNHSIHVAKGVGCETCHGRVDEMPLMYQHASLQMEWCLECHRNPEEFVRPRDEIYTMGYERQDPDEGIRLVAEYNIQSLETCSTCHR